MGTHIDDHEVVEMYRDLSKAPGRIQRRAPDVLRKGAVQIKKGMRADFAASMFSGGHRGTYHPRTHMAINFDRLSRYEYEIGVDKGGSGSLGNILAFGAGAHSGPIVDHTAALRRETPEVLRHFGELGEEAVFGDRTE